MTDLIKRAIIEAVATEWDGREIRQMEGIVEVVHVPADIIRVYLTSTSYGMPPLSELSIDHIANELAAMWSGWTYELDDGTVIDIGNTIKADFIRHSALICYPGSVALPTTYSSADVFNRVCGLEDDGTS